MLLDHEGANVISGLIYWGLHSWVAIVVRSRAWGFALKAIAYLSSLDTILSASRPQ